MGGHLQSARIIQDISPAAALMVILIGAVISGFFLQWAARTLSIFDTTFSKCFLVALIGICADYGIAMLVVSEGYINGFVGFLIGFFINLAIIVGFFKIGWWRAFLVYFLMRVLSFIIGCLCCCGITRRFPSL